ncbi:MAG: right-handed parallel beta-helix repeat-containing protein [Bacteroidota bacterium]
MKKYRYYCPRLIYLFFSIFTIGLNAQDYTITATTIELTKPQKKLLQSKKDWVEQKCLPFQFDPQELANHLAIQNDSFKILLNIGDTYQFDLHGRADDPRTSDYQSTIETATGMESVEHLPNHFYSGYIQGIPQSRFRMYLGNESLQATLDDGQFRYDVFSLESFIPYSGGSKFIICKDSIIPPPGPTLTDCRNPELSIAMVADYSTYQLFGGDNNPEAINEILGTMEGAALSIAGSVFDREFNLFLNLVHTHVGVTPSVNFGDANPNPIATNVNAFYARRFPCVEADMLILFTRELEGVVGHQAGGGLCEFGIDGLPVVITELTGGQQPDIDLAGFIITHEMGHAFGAKHLESLTECQFCGMPPPPYEQRPVMCTEVDKTNLKEIWFSSCSKAAIQETINDYCEDCLGDQEEVQCNECELKASVEIDNPNPLLNCEEGDIVNVTVVISNDCDAKDIQVDIGVLWDDVNEEPYFEFLESSDQFETDVLAPHPIFQNVKLLTSSPEAYEENEFKIFRFRLKILKDRVDGNTGLTWNIYIDENYVVPLESDVITPLPQTPELRTSSISSLIFLEWLKNTPECSVKNDRVLKMSGDLIVDQDYCFLDSRILMGPDSRIVVRNGATLVFDGTTVSACGNMWEGIVIESGGSFYSRKSTISNAVTAVNLQAGAFFSTNQTSYINNLKGIEVPPGGGTRTLIIGAGNRFVGEGLLPPPHQDKQPYAGILLNDVSGVTIGVPPGHHGDIPPNVFARMENGIIARNADFSLTNALISNLRPERPPAGYSDISSYGVYAEGSGIHTAIIDGGNTPSVRIHNSDYGIYLSGMNGDVINANISDVEVGVWVAYTPYGQIRVEDSEISANDYGIALLQANTVSAFIINNEITALDNAEAAIFATGCSGYIGIRDNSFYLDEARKGIYLLDSKHGDIQNNTLLLYNSFPSGDIAALQLEYSQYIAAFCNLISSDGEGTEESWSVYVQDAADNSLSCNATGFTRHGISFLGSCLGSTLKGNEIDYHYAGLELGGGVAGSDAVIGPQALQGNTWWEDYGWKGAWHYAMDQLTRKASEFIVNDVNSVEWPPNIDELVNDLGWFALRPDMSFSCPQTTICPEGVIGDSRAAISTSPYEAIAQGHIRFPYFQACKTWLNQQQLYDAMQSGQISADSEILSQFEQRASVTNIGRWHELEQLLTSKNEQNGSGTNFFSTVRNLTYSLQELDVKPEWSNKNADLLDQRNQLIFQLSEQQKNWKKFYMNSIQDQRERIERAWLIGEQIRPKGLHELYWQQVNQLYIELLQTGFGSLNESQKSKILEIAAKCPYECGPAVYRARGMSRLFGIYDYDDTKLCERSASAVKGSNSKSLIDAFPNPASDWVTFSYQSAVDEEMTLTIYNSQGKEVGVFPLPNHLSAQTINLGTLENGYYLYSLIVGDQIVQTKKLVLVR